MDHFRKFYTVTTRICALRNRTIEPLRQRKKHTKIDFPVVPCSHDLLKRPEKPKSNLPVFKIYQYPINLCAVKFSSADNLDSSRYAIVTFEVEKKLPVSLLWDRIKASFQGIMITLFVDQNFGLKEFAVSSLQAAKIVSKLVSEKRLSELDGLVTSECLAKLTESIDNWVPFDREDISMTDNDFISGFCYSIDLIEEQNRKALQMSMYFIILKNVKGVIDKLDDNVPRDFQQVFDKMKSLHDETKRYGANYRFIRWMDKDTWGDWIINGINHFSLPIVQTK